MESKLSCLKDLMRATALALTLPLSSLAQAAPETCDSHFPPPHLHRGPMPGAEMPPPGAPLPPYLHDLNLSEAQQDKVFAVLHAQAPQMRELAKQLRKSHESLATMAIASEFDERAARAHAAAGAQARADMALLRARSEHELYAVLTPEQRQQAQEKRRQFEARGRFGHDDRPRGR